MAKQLVLGGVRKPEKIVFRRAEPWCCPRYQDYIIYERPCGKDIYGHETHQYALFRTYPLLFVRRFNTRKKAYQYMFCLGYHQILFSNPRELVIQVGNKCYKLEKYTRKLYVRQDREQLSEWFDSYSECLREAKQIVERDRNDLR